MPTPATRERARLRGLYAVTPECRDTAQLVRRVEACLAGGAALVQYRAKGIPGGLALVQARALLGPCRSAGVPLIVNDSIELAVACGADGVHLGRDDASVREARLLLPDAIIGASCYHDPELARAAAAQGADYVAVGSVFASSTKPAAVRAPLALLAKARAASGLPVAAIGGITAQNAPDAIAAGADMLAVIAALFDAADVRSAAAAIADLYAAPSQGVVQDVRPQPQSL